ncbi:MAG: hypothetical protein KC609_08635 [Myxococcales bacterium]|nr:hypothetical protein [Myxococcales bacterium]
MRSSKSRIQRWPGAVTACAAALAILLGASGCFQHRIYLGGGAGYGQTFEQNPRERLVTLRATVQGTPKAGNGAYLGLALDLEAMFNPRGRWMTSIGGRFGPGYRIGPADFFLLVGTSSFNFDQIDGRFGFGMFSPQASGGVIFQLTKRVALGLTADVRYLLRFVPKDNVPIWNCGLSLYFWSESYGPPRPPRDPAPSPH